MLLLSMHIRCWDELVKYGALDVLQREYGSLLSSQVEPEYNVSLEIDLEQVPADSGMAHLLISVGSEIHLSSYQRLARHSSCHSPC